MCTSSCFVELLRMHIEKKIGCAKNGFEKTDLILLGNRTRLSKII